MTLIFLNTNEKKTEVMVFDSSGTCRLLPTVESPESAFKTISFMVFKMNSDFKLDCQIIFRVKPSLFYLRQWVKVGQ